MAVAALTEQGHVGEVYQVTGPQLLTFADAVDEIASATGRDIRFVPISRRDFAAALAAEAVPEDYIWLLDYLFTTVLDGRNQYVADGVQRALGARLGTSGSAPWPRRRRAPGRFERLRSPRGPGSSRITFRWGRHP